MNNFATDGRVTLKVSTQVADCKVPVSGRGPVRLKNLHVITLLVGDMRFEFLAGVEQARMIADLMTKLPDSVIGKNGATSALIIPGRMAS